MMENQEAKAAEQMHGARTASTAHTPGTWLAKPSIHGNEYMYVQMGEDETYTTLEVHPADARLIAAAPDMLSALNDVMVGGNHLASILVGKLGGDFATKYPSDLDPQDALRLLSATIEYDVWCCWAAIMRARAAIAKATEPPK